MYDSAHHVKLILIRVLLAVNYAQLCNALQDFEQVKTDN